MDRLVRHNVLALSGRAVEASRRRRRAAARQDGDDHPRQPRGDRVHPDAGIEELELAEAAQFSSLADETPEGRSIVVLAKQYGIRERELAAHDAASSPSRAETRMSGVDLERQPVPQGRRRRDHRLVGEQRRPGRRPSCRSSST